MRIQLPIKRNTDKKVKYPHSRKNIKNYEINKYPKEIRKVEKKKKTMYISAGKEWVEDKNIIGVFDLDITSQSRLTRDYLKAAEKRGSVLNAAEDIPKIFIVCTEKNSGSEKVILCQTSSATFRSRVEKNSLTGK